MIRRMLLVTILAVAAATLVSAAVDVTFVLKNGQRESGQLFYHANLGDIGLMQGGRERMFPFDDIAVLAFDGGDPRREELEKLPESPNPPELNRHMLALRNGETLPGKFYGFGEGHLIFDVRTPSGSADRRTFGFGDVARLYFSGAGARHVYRDILGSGAAVQPSNPGPNNQEFRVEASRPWTPTGMFVNRGDRVRFSASGEITIGQNVVAQPGGNNDLERRVSYPVRNMGAGGLIARVGNAAPFPVGSNTNPIAVSASGQLFLGINDDRFTDNRGWFTVRVER